MPNAKSILNEMLYQLKENLLDKWYPKVIDEKHGGYFSNLSYDFTLAEHQEKMVVTQARHIWTLSKAAEFFNSQEYKNYAIHGIKFLQNKIWDNRNGGFFQIRSREGNFSDIEGWHTEKRVYGNAYGLYGTSALYKITQDPKHLKFAVDIFSWIEKHAYDPLNKGYYQFFTEDNKVYNRMSRYKSLANDSNEVGYKDQNSSIHLLEAFTEFYKIHKDPIVKERLNDMLFLIRDVITTDDGYLQLFFTDSWEPISFRNSSKIIREANYGLDHVSFGHDYETAFLMLEASHALELKNDIQTLRRVKIMVDHALENGFDNVNGGFYEEGYYFRNETTCSIIKDTKNWWAQAEALNIFLIMSKIFPNEKKYIDTFVKEWDYINKYIINHENGDWFWGGLDKEPHYKKETKGKIWKGTYHTGRALMNCIVMLADENYPLYKSSKGFRDLVNQSNEFITHWKKISETL